MATILYNNHRPATRSTRAFNSVLNELLRDTLASYQGARKSFVPQADILESEAGFELHLALPGVSKDAVTIDFQEGNLDHQRGAQSPRLLLPKRRKTEGRTSPPVPPGRNQLRRILPAPSACPTPWM